MYRKQYATATRPNVSLFAKLILIPATVLLLGALHGACSDDSTGPSQDASRSDAMQQDATTGGDAGDAGGGSDAHVNPGTCPDEGAVHVATTGEDSSDCGSKEDPCATIAQGLSRAHPYETVCVHAGTYNESWLAIPGGVTLLSADGPLAAKIFSDDQSAVRFEGVTGATIDGFEVYGTWDAGEPGDGLIRVLDADDILIKNVMAHDAPHDMDVVKVSGQVHHLTIEGLIAWNPGHRTNGMYQEDVDIFGSGAQDRDPPPVSDVIVRGCWLFHIDGKGDWLIYSKIYAENIMYENNVFGPSAGGGWGNAAVGIGTEEASIPDASAPAVNHAVVRNNVFVGIKGDAALAVMNADDTWVYNNVFYDNSGSDLRSVIMLRGNNHPLGATRVFNNIFVGNHPSKDGDGKLFWVRDTLPDPWYKNQNLYQDNIAESDIDYTDEFSGIYDQDPGFVAPAVPETSDPNLDRITQILTSFGITQASPAVDKGIDALGVYEHPSWRPGVVDRRWDALGDPRPEGDTWDIGIDEVQ